MTDIVERLRSAPPSLSFDEHDPTFDLRHEAAAEIERLRAASQWQSIKTAPKDGTQIIVIDATNDQQWVAFWSTSAWVGGAWIPYENRSDTISISATHWQPLPSPPIQEGGE